MLLNKVFRSALLFVFCTLSVHISPSSAEPDLLTSDERAWLTEHPEIRVAFYLDYPPLSYGDEKNQPTGFVMDYLKLVEQRLGIKFKLVFPTFQQQAMNTPEEKQADVVSLYADTSERRKYWLFTKPYLDFPIHLVVRDDAPSGTSLKTLEGQRVSVVGAWATSYFLEKSHPGIPQDKVEDTCTGLQHVAFGESKGMLTDLPVASWCLRKQGIFNLKTAGETGFRYSMGMAVRKDWPMLGSILEKGQAAINSEEIEEIYQRWNANNPLQPSWLEKNTLWITLATVGLLAALIIRLFVWDGRLQKHILKQLSTPDFSGAHHQALPHKPSLELTLPSALLLVLGLTAIIYFLLSREQWHSPQGYQMLTVITGLLTMLALAGGYKLGSLRRGGEVEQLLGKLMQQISMRKQNEKMLSASEQRLARQHEALVALTAIQLTHWGKPEAVFRKITEMSANALEVERASIWLLSKDQQTLRCVDMYHRGSGRHSADDILLAKDLPIYFHALAAQRVIAIDDAMTHPATSELSGEYLPVNGIGAMLDSTIWLNEKIAGVICHEHVGGRREWPLDEQNFAGSIADLARLTIETYQRRQAEDELARHRDRLEEIVESRTLELRRSEERFRQVIDRAPVAILCISSQGTLIEFNPEAEKITGYSREHALGKSFVKLLFDRPSRKPILAYLKRIQAGEHLRSEEQTLICADGKKLEMGWNAGLYRDGAGQLILILIGQDISQQKIMESAMRHAQESAESADRIKSLFVASMSHELRTPLNSIIGFIGVVLQGMSGEINERQKDQLGRAYHSARHLLALISDVIDISKIEAGYIDVYPERFELKQLLLETRHAVQHLAEEKFLEIEIECDDRLHANTDRKRLYQAVLNLVSNAVKYTERGWIKIIAKPVGNEIIISVQDTGIGISQEALSKLFQPFERAESRLKIKTPGTGLGLYLTRKILTQLLGGSIEAESMPETGSTFTIRIPAKFPKQQNADRLSIL